MAINWLNPPQANPRDVAVLGGFGQFPNQQPQMPGGMPQQLPFGFMDPNQAEMMNWEQSRPAMGPIEAMAGMPDLYRQAAQQQYSHQPMADSFLRRFGQPMVEQQQQSPMQPDMLQALMAQGGMIDAMTNADARGAGTSFDQGARGGEGEAYYHGGLDKQPWLDEFAAAGRAGVDLPMLHGNAGQQSAEMQAGIAQRRQQRLGTPIPMDQRRAAVQRQAVSKSEQRAARMGDISPNEQFFNEAGRFAGGMGGGGDFLNAVMFGPEYGANMARTNQDAYQNASQQQFQREMMQNPLYWAAQGVAPQTQMQISALTGSGSVGGGMPGMPPNLQTAQTPQEFVNAVVEGKIDPSQAPSLWTATGHQGEFPVGLRPQAPNTQQGVTPSQYLNVLQDMSPQEMNGVSGNWLGQLFNWMGATPDDPRGPQGRKRF